MNDEDKKVRKKALLDAIHAALYADIWKLPCTLEHDFKKYCEHNDLEAQTRAAIAAYIDKMINDEKL